MLADLEREVYSRRTVNFEESFLYLWGNQDEGVHWSQLNSLPLF